MSKDKEASPGVGLDIGTMNLVSARSAGGKTVTRRVRDAFLDLDLDAKRQLRLSRVDYVEEGNSLLILGDAALTMANLFKREARRPLARGVVAAGEHDAQKILAYLIRQVVGEPLVPGENCFYSVPAAPVDIQGQDVIFHREALRAIVSQLGFTATPINEALAIVFSQCAGSTFSGLAFSYGSGMANIALAYQSMEAFSFSLARGGDWIDQQTAKALGLTAAKVCTIKEAGVDLLAPKNREEQALVIYIRDLIRYSIEQTAAAIRQGTGTVDIPPDSALPLVLSGGTTRAGNFLACFRQEFDAVKKNKGFPLPITDIVMARDPMTAVAEGLLVLAGDE